MKGIVIKDVELKEEHSSASKTIMLLQVGEKIDILNPRVGTYEIKWVNIQTKEGIKGFIKQENLIEIGSKYTLVERSADVFNQAFTNSMKSFIIQNQAQIFISGIVPNEEGIWYEVKDSVGRTGYMNSTCEIELTRELIDELSRDKGDMLTVFANAGIIGGVVVIAYSIFRFVYIYNMSGAISGVSIILFCVGVLAIFIDIFRKRIKKKYE